MVLETQSTKAVWFIDPIIDPLEIEAKIPEATDIVLVNPAKSFTSAADVEMWDIVSQKLKRDKNVMVIFSPGEYRVKDIHIKGSTIDPVVHYILETPEGTVGVFQKEPTDEFIKRYAPLDVLLGNDTAIAGVQLDMEPFYVVLPAVTDEYKKKSGVSEIKETDHVNIKKISQEDRDGVINLSVCAIS